MEETVRDVLQAAVAAVDGSERTGQTNMALAVAEAFSSGKHLLVQAGTGTGKSLGYLVPAVLNKDRVVVATATLALQNQLLKGDIPALESALSSSGRMPPRHAVVKGRSNYACLYRVRDGIADDQETLVDVPSGALGEEVLRLREWAEDQSTENGVGDRDSAVPHGDLAWRQVSVSARDCVGAQRCPFGQECFAERAKADAAEAHLVITNHAMLAIDAIEGVPMLPDYDVVIVDEAHELVQRVTQAATAELDPGQIHRAATSARRHVEDGGSADDLSDAADALADALTHVAPGRIEAGQQHLVAALALVRDTARSCFSSFPKADAKDADPSGHQARARVEDIRTVAERMVVGSETDVLWVEESRQQFGLRIAPVDVAGTLRDKLFAEKTVVLTSATLSLGGTFDPIARNVGLGFGDQAWTGLDVGSPFQYGTQGILYAAKHLPPPGRDGLSAAHLAEITALVQAAGGRTLGLFSSRRAAEQAAAHVREQMPELELWCQGDAQLPELLRRFSSTPEACLFGTLSLWQGVDIPGSTCTLVIIDRIPFPRPDDPVASARQRLVEKHGGNGFMQVAAQHAALWLAQGTGRLIRRQDDRGVVAILDARIITARYGGFLRQSLPPMFRTTDQSAVIESLRRLDAAAHDGTALIV